MDRILFLVVHLVEQVGLGLGLEEQTTTCVLSSPRALASLVPRATRAMVVLAERACKCSSQSLALVDREAKPSPSNLKEME